MQNEKNNAYLATCAYLDAVKHAVDFSCAMMRVAFVTHAHRDGFDDWISGPSGHHLTGAKAAPNIDDRAQRLLSRFVGNESDLGSMPGFEPAETDARLREFAP